ncbi:MAG: nucleoside-diphosphate kinase [Alistipes sp.]|nr:nucleoside-diphosphate kinase [Alistipes sp.]
MGNLTFTMIKPDAVRAHKEAEILKHLTDAGFRIVALRMRRMSRAEAEKFYAVHRDKPFFGALVEFMTSGPVVAAVLEKENAVPELRKTVGATDPAEAAERTVRRLFGTNKTMNAIHASDSDENARYEWAIHFADSDLMLQ